MHLSLSFFLYFFLSFFLSLSLSLSLFLQSLRLQKRDIPHTSSNISTRQPGQLKAKIDGDIARLSGIDILSSVLFATSHGYREPTRARTHTHRQKVVSSRNHVAGQCRSQSDSLVGHHASQRGRRLMLTIAWLVQEMDSLDEEMKSRHALLE